MTKELAQKLAKLNRSYRAKQISDSEWCVWQDSADHRVEFDSATIARFTTAATLRDETATLKDTFADLRAVHIARNTTTTQQESNTMPSHILYTARNTTPHHNESVYWILATRESDGQWHMAFGDYTRSVVQFERDDYRSTYAAKNLRIVRSADSNAAIEHTMRTLNIAQQLTDNATRG
jgi:hypothetical protein